MRIGILMADQFSLFLHDTPYVHGMFAFMYCHASGWNLKHENT